MITKSEWGFRKHLAIAPRADGLAIFNPTIDRLAGAAAMQRRTLTQARRKCLIMPTSAHILTA